MHTWGSSVDKEEARVRMPREAVEKRVSPSDFKKFLLLDLIVTCIP